MFADIMLSCSSDMDYMKLIKMDIETDLNLSPVGSKPCSFPVKHYGWVCKELEDVEKVEIIQRSLSSYVSLLATVP